MYYRPASLFKLENTRTIRQIYSEKISHEAGRGCDTPGTRVIDGYSQDSRG